MTQDAARHDLAPAELEALLSANALLVGVPPELIASLASRARLLPVDAGTVLFREGDPGAELYLVVSGAVEVYAERDGERRAIATFHAGSYFGELALLGTDTRSASARAIERARLVPIDRETFTLLTRDHPAVMMNLSRGLVTSLVTTTRAMVRRTRGRVVAVVARQVEQWYPLLAALVPAVERALGAAARLTPLPEHSGTPDSLAAQVGDLARGERLAIVPLDLEFTNAAVLAGAGFDRVFVLAEPEGLSRLAHALGDARRDPRLEIVTVGDDLATRRRVADLCRALALPRPLVVLPERADCLRRGADLTAMAPDASGGTEGLARLTRALAGQRIGLALGAGGARGFAHIGVLRYLEERGIPVDAVAGSSIGSLVAAGHAAGIDSMDAERRLEHWLRSGQRRIVRPVLSRHSVLSGAGLDQTCRDLFGDARFTDLRTPLAIAVADLVTGRGLVARDGMVWKAVRASCSIPAVFPPVRVSGRVLVDGGVTDPVPVDALASLGADIRIAVNISFTPEDLRQWARAEGRGEPVGARRERVPGLIEAYNASFGISLADRAQAAADAADVVIRPRFAVTAWHEFASAPDQLRRGYDAALAASVDLERVIPWLQPRRPD